MKWKKKKHLKSNIGSITHNGFHEKRTRGMKQRKGGKHPSSPSVAREEEDSGESEKAERSHQALKLERR